MPSINNSRVAVLLFSAVFAGFAIAQEPPSATQVRIFTPFTTAGLSIGLAVTDEVSGSCFSSSLASPLRPDTWRCTVENAIYDPCFINLFGGENTLACAEVPWDANVVLLTLTEALPSDDRGEPDFTQALPWALELENGRRCTMMTGAMAPLAGMRITYGCEDGAYVVDDVDRTLPLWRVFYQTPERSLSLDQVGVVTAWY
jgi:hypothetical protein